MRCAAAVCAVGLPRRVLLLRLPSGGSKHAPLSEKNRVYNLNSREHEYVKFCPRRVSGTGQLYRSSLTGSPFGFE